MKKLLSLLLVFCMVFTLMACSASKDAQTPKNDPSDASVDSSSDTTADDPVADSSEDPTDESKEEQPTDEDMDVTILGEGATSFILIVEDLDGTKTTFEICTDETTVGAALLGVELISGTVEAYGLYVKEVNGITADWDVDGTYWAFYEDGAYAALGVDSTNIDPNVTYSLVKTAG